MENLFDPNEFLKDIVTLDHKDKITQVQSSSESVPSEVETRNMIISGHIKGMKETYVSFLKYRQQILKKMTR